MGKAFFSEQIHRVIEKLDYQELNEDGFFLFVPKNSAAKEVS